MKNEHFVITLLQGPIFLLKGERSKAHQGGIPCLQAELEWTGYIQITELINNDEDKNKESALLHKNCKGRVPKQCSKKFLHAKCMTVLSKSAEIKDKFSWSYNFCIQSQISANNKKFLHGQSVAWKISSWIHKLKEKSLVYSMVLLHSYILSAKAHLCLYCRKQQWGPNVLLQKG